MKYHKLVRDKIPEIIRQKGEDLKTHVADDAEYWERLKEKLREEVDEFLREETIEELADVREVLEAIEEYKEFAYGEVQRIKEKKAAERGKFRKRIILDES